MVYSGDIINKDYSTYYFTYQLFNIMIVGLLSLLKYYENCTLPFNLRNLNKY